MTTENLQPDLESIEKALKDEKQRLSRQMFHSGTPEHNPMKLKGIGYTRKSHEQSKKAKKSAKLQRRKNQKISEKKFRPTGSKKRK